MATFSVTPTIKEETKKKPITASIVVVTKKLPLHLPNIPKTRFPNSSYFYRKKIMLTKTSVINTISRLPDNFSIDELVDKMILLEKIEKGIQDADNGRVISETELEKQMEGW